MSFLDLLIVDHMSFNVMVTVVHRFVMIIVVHRFAMTIISLLKVVLRLIITVLTLVTSL